ncbi:uncharacterized protein J8A68_001317 [[Candida] subhashii]|uniref:Uncharacterized protein n=1 Tax=[Candida] subhashii TaxID=561895 RepID=A0A8J5QRC5_9ASCO|nr:uncharacterized protein J8A68_001317 [[Candida] subhashii]KAG7665261.1 hypothetical protein J8A68_001317 [[Candida] subhashii]
MTSSSFSNNNEVQPDSTPKHELTYINPCTVYDYPSSPIDQPQPSPLKSSPRNVLDDLHQIQQDRSNRRLNPLSSSPTREKYTGDTARCSVVRARVTSLNRTQCFNNRNKHNKMREVRDQNRQDKVLTKREKSFSDQCNNDWADHYEHEFDDIMGGVDVDQLIEEEQDASADYLADQLEKELDELELEEELEMIELMSKLELENKSE